MSEDFEKFQAIYDTVIEFAIKYGFQVVGAIIILVLGLFLAKLAGSLVLKICNATINETNIECCDDR